MEAVVSFVIPKFHSVGTKQIKFKAQSDKESTFRSILKSFNKTLDKNWQSVEFQFENKTILVCKHWLIETNFSFEKSHHEQEI